MAIGKRKIHLVFLGAGRGEGKSILVITFYANIKLVER